MVIACVPCLCCPRMYKSKTKDLPFCKLITFRHLTMDPEYSLQDVVRCHLCETPVPPLHCVICKLHLCKACVGEHITDLSKEHIMVAFGKRRSTSTPIYTKCPKHSTKQCELFCEQCDIPICVHCTSSNEHLEHKTVDILKSFEAKREVIQRDLTDFEELIYPKYQDIASSIPVQKADWNKNSQKLRSSIDKQEQYLHKEIENISQKKKSELDDMDSKLLNVLNKQEDKISHTISEITQSIADAKKLLNSNDVSRVSSYKSRNAEFRRLPPKLVASLPNLTPKKMNNEHLHQHFGSLSALSIKIEERGFIIDSPSAKSSLMNTPLFNEPRIITVIKTQYGTSNRLRSLSCLSDDVIWMTGEETS
nr:tripartite motif-containing protein 40-like isoform X1 [Crassostrea gigas]